METNTINNMEELEQLRAQYQTLKEQLDKQEIVSDKLLRETFKSKVKSINSVKKTTIGCGIFVLLVAPFAFHYNPVINASWYFIIATYALMLFCIYRMYMIHKDMTERAADANLLAFAEKAKKMQVDYKNYVKVSIPLAILWVGYLVLEIFKNNQDIRLACFTMISVLVGGTIGGICGIRMNHKVIDECQKIIDQIKGE